MAKESEQSVSLSPEQLQAFITTAVTAAVAAAKAPSAIEQKRLDAEAEQIKQQQEYRLRVSDGVKQGAAQKKWAQSVCTHEHRNGDTHLVFIQEQGGPGYLLCQKNQCKIRPSVDAAHQTDKSAIYDTDLFNRGFQKIASGAEIFG